MSDQTPRPDSPRRLERSSSDRMIAGVCGGLGSYFSVDPLILRIAFAVSVFFGGLGIVLYLAMGLLVPVDDAPDGKPVIAMSRSQGLAIVVAVAILVIAIPLFGALFAWIGDPGVLWLIALVVLVVAAATAWRDRGRRNKDTPPAGAEGEPAATTTDLSQPATTTDPSESTTTVSAATTPRRRSSLWTVLLVCGTALFSLAAFLASALTVGFGLGALVAATIAAGGIAIVALAFGAGSAARWLVAPLAAMVLGAGAAEAADLDLEGGVGEETYRPVYAASIPEDGYRLGAGELSIDLRDMSWRDGQLVPLRASAGAGYLEIVVPRDVCVVGDASARAGYVMLGGHEDEGIEAEVQGDLRPQADLPTGSRPASDREGPRRNSNRRPAELPPPVVEIDASVDFGAIQVLNAGAGINVDEDDPHAPLSSASLAEMQRLNERACAG